MLQKYISENLASKESDAVKEAVEEVEKRINGIKKETIIIILINIFTMIIVPFLCNNTNCAKLIISLVVLLSVVYTIVEVLKEYKRVYEFIVICDMRPKKFIFQEIRNEVKLRVNKELDDLAWYEAIANKYAGKGVEELSLSITSKSNEIFFKNIIQVIGIFGITWLIYIFYIRGLLLESIDLTFYEAIFYPFILMKNLF